MSNIIEIRRNHFQNTIYEIPSIFDNKKTIDNLNNINFEHLNNLSTYDSYYNILQNNFFIDLKTHVENYLNIFTKKILKKQNFKIDRSWFQAYKENQWHGMHVHGNLQKEYSIIFYLQIGNNSAPTIFYNTGYPYVTGNTINIKPELSKFVIFQSYIPHEVPPNKDNERIIFSSNFDVF